MPARDRRRSKLSHREKAGRRGELPQAGVPAQPGHELHQPAHALVPPAHPDPPAQVQEQGRVEGRVEGDEAPERNRRPPGGRPRSRGWTDPSSPWRARGPGRAASCRRGAAPRGGPGRGARPWCWSGTPTATAGASGSRPRDGTRRRSSRWARSLRRGAWRRATGTPSPRAGRARSRTWRALAAGSRSGGESRRSRSRDSPARRPSSVAAAGATIRRRAAGRRGARPAGPPRGAPSRSPGSRGGTGRCRRRSPSRAPRRRVPPRAVAAEQGRGHGILLAQPSELPELRVRGRTCPGDPRAPGSAGRPRSPRGAGRWSAPGSSPRALPSSRARRRKGAVGRARGRHRLRRAFRDDVSPLRPRSRTELDEPVAGGEEQGVVLHDQDARPLVAPGRAGPRRAAPHPPGAGPPSARRGCRASGARVGRWRSLAIFRRCTSPPERDSALWLRTRYPSPTEQAASRGARTPILVAPQGEHLGEPETEERGSDSPRSSIPRASGGRPVPPQSSQLTRRAGRKPMSSLWMPSPPQAEQGRRRSATRRPAARAALALRRTGPSGRRSSPRKRQGLETPRRDLVEHHRPRTERRRSRRAAGLRAAPAPPRS